jgi:two-component sensor histidine kinase
MILYEVLSNAVVPRGESTEKGTVSIQLNKTGEKQCTLSVSDEGQAISSRRFQQSGLGLELVYILCEQIHGRCRLEASGAVQIIFVCSATVEQCV